MTSKTSSHKMTTTQWAHMEKDIHEYADLKEKNEGIGKLIQKSQSEQAEARKGQAECAVTIKHSQARIETSQKIQAKAKENLKIAEEKQNANNEVIAKLTEDSANGVIKAKTTLVQVQSALNKMPGNGALLVKTQNLITHTETLGKTNSEGVNIFQDLINLQASIKELMFEIQALVKSNAAAKK